MKQEEASVAFFEQEAHSFVIRVWREKREVVNAVTEWRGWVDHVQSGRRHYFQGVPAMQDIIALYLEETPDLNKILHSIQQ